MRLSKTSAQAALAVAFLAEQKPGSINQARQVAEHLHVPTDSALKILQALSRQGIIQSQLGRSGGYRMHLRPDDVTLLRIVEVIDGPISGAVGFTTNQGVVGQRVNILQAVCNEAATRLRDELGRVTVADLVRGDHSRVLGLAEN